MSTPFYDLASLVVVPSGYKSGKIYAQKPLTTDGQLTFSRASTATRVNASGLIEEVASNVPRLDYQGATCGPRLLLEPQRTNFFLQSSNYANAIWEKSEIAASSSAGISPDGTNNAVKIIPSTTGGRHFFAQNTTITAGTVYTQTIYAKSDGYNFVQMTGSTGFSTSFCNFDLSNGTLGSTDGGVASIESAGNGWYRIRYTLTAQSTASGRIIMAIVESANSTRLDQFAGDGTSGVLFYGAQIEAGSYPTSLINTTTAAVTRLADSCIKENIAGTLPTAYPFTLFTEFEVTPAIEGAALTFSNIASPTEYFSIDHNSGFYRALSRPSGIISLVQSTTPATVGTHKICAVFTSTTIKLFVDGVLESSGANAQAFNALVNDIIIGQLRSVGDTTTRNSVKQALVFKSGLTDAQAIEITTL